MYWSVFVKCRPCLRSSFKCLRVNSEATNKISRPGNSLHPRRRRSASAAGAAPPEQRPWVCRSSPCEDQHCSPEGSLLLRHLARDTEPALVLNADPPLSQFITSNWTGDKLGKPTYMYKKGGMSPSVCNERIDQMLQKKTTLLMQYLVYTSIYLQYT